MKRIKQLVTLFILTLLFFSCNSNILFDDNAKIKYNNWDMKEKKSFIVNIKKEDLKYSYKCAVNIRHTTDYKYNNIFFFITTIFPDNSIYKEDTIECILSNFDGSWKGKGNSNIKDNRFWFAKDIKFPAEGQYIFQIQQATKDSILIGVKDIGLHIEKQIP